MKLTIDLSNRPDVVAAYDLLAGIVGINPGLPLDPVIPDNIVPSPTATQPVPTAAPAQPVVPTPVTNVVPMQPQALAPAPVDTVQLAATAIATCKQLGANINQALDLLKGYNVTKVSELDGNQLVAFTQQVSVMVEQARQS